MARLSMEEDRILVGRVLAGDSGGFAALYDKYKVSLFRTALAITEEQGAAEEILQDCFLRAYAQLPRLDLSRPLGPWLHRILVNLCYTWARKRRFFYIPIEEMVDRLVSGTQASPEKSLEQGEVREKVEEALRALNLEQRLVVILFYLQEFSLGEIAYIMDSPLGTVKSRLHYARQVLRQKLAAPQAILPEQT